MTNQPTDPARARFFAAQAIAVSKESRWTVVKEMPEGEVIWRQPPGGIGDTVTLTRDGWLVYSQPGGRVLHERRMRATPDFVAEL